MIDSLETKNTKILDEVSDEELREVWDSLDSKTQGWLLERAEGVPLGEVLSSKEDFCTYFGLDSDTLQS